MPIFQLTDELVFPPAELAEENGLLAIGGDLSPRRLLLAYRNGIFPWYSEGEPILWWSISPRLVIFPDEFKVPKRLARFIRQERYSISFDRDFRQVITACASPEVRKDKGTWITKEMIEAYCTLHDLGYAHSVECWLGNELAGGLYGIALGGIFFGESMFSREPDSSKMALVHLVNKLKGQHFKLIDCQMKTKHLMQFGAREIPGSEFHEILEKTISKINNIHNWQQG